MDNKNNQEPLVSNDGDPTVIAETPAGPSNDVEMKTSLSQEESKTTVSASGKDVVETETDRVSSVPLPSNTTPSSNAKDSTMDDAADIGQTSRNKNEMEEVKGSETTTKDAIEVAEAAVSSKADTSTEDTTTTEQLEAVLAPTTVAAITSSSTNPNNGITGKEVTQHSNDGDSESKQVAAAATTTTTTTDLMDPIDTHAIEELGRRYPKRARERIWDAQAAEDEKKTSTKTKKKKKEEEDTANRNAPPSSPPGPSPDSTVGRYVEQSKLLGTTTGQFYPLNGQIIEYRAAEGRIPGRYAVRWEYPSADGESADFIQEDEWVEEDLQAFDEAASKGNAPIMTYSAYKSTSHSHLPPSLKVALENVRQRYQQIVERDLGESHVLSSLIVVAALEEALQASLQQQQEAEFAAASSDAVTTKKTTTSKPHPPLYYNANPSSYLQPPSYDKSSASSSPQHKKAQMTPTVLAQRLRQGCQWAWAFLQSKQESTPLLKAPVAKRSFADVMITEVGAADAAAIAAASMSDMGTSVAQRRSVRAARLAPTSYAEEDGISTGRARTATPGLEDPNPVQRGGRIAMWWIQALEEKTNGKVPSKDSTDGDNTSTNVPASAKPNKSKKGKKTNSTAVDTNDEDEVMAPQESFDDDVPDEETKDDDDDYTGGDVEQDEDDESLGDVEKERTRLSPVADLEKESVDEDREEEEEEEENEEHFIVWDNPYLPSSFPALLEYLARPKSITMEEVQKAMDDVTLRIRHNKRSADHGIDLSDLAPSDKVILGFEIPDHPSKGKVVLKCVSGETVGELQRLDANTFSRCKFELEVISDEEKAIQIRRKEDILQQEMEFKERKVWDRWRFRGIHEGYSVWPGWEEGALEWVKENVRSEPAHVSEVDQVIEDPKDDEALAKILEESEAGSGGRRRTARRAAATATEGVFYGNQSQLSQKQLMDAMLRIVKANPFQTLIKMQTLVADDSSDPIRRCRIALGKMLYKRNLIARKAVTSQVGDKVLTIDLESGKRLIELNSTSDFDDNESSAAKDLLEYLSFLHENEIKLRELLLKQLSHIPIPVIATAADERVGSLESLDDNDFDDVTSIKWETSGHPLLQKLLYRPPTQSTLGMETTVCNWYKVVDFSKSIKSEEEDAEDYAMERRMRFRVEPTVGQDNQTMHEGPTLILTEAQVHAGVKAAEMKRQQTFSTPSFNPYSRISGDSITLVPIESLSGEASASSSFTQIHGRIVGHDTKSEATNSDVIYRVLVLPDPDVDAKHQKDAFWAILEVRADSSYICRPEGESTWFAIESKDFHQDSDAYHECEKILNWLRSQSKASPFMAPVDPVALGIPSYPQIVKHPMDISTITDKLEKGHYASIPPGQSFGQSPSCRMLNGPFRKDIELMFDNAVLFNPPDDWIHQAALSLKKSAIKKIEAASSAAERSFRHSGGRQKNSLYLFDDSDQDMYEYESDQDDEYGGGRRRKRRKDSKGSTNKDEAAARPIEYSIRLHNCLKDGNDLRGPFASLAINTDASTFSLPGGWNCRKRIASTKDFPEEEEAEELVLSDAEKEKQELAREMADLVALHKALGENETSGLRRSARAHKPSEGGSAKTATNVGDLEYFFRTSSSEDLVLTKSPKSRLDVEILLEERHEEHYSKLYYQFEKDLAPNGRFGMYTNGSFPPYLGHVIPSKNKHLMTWEIRSPFAVPAIRWVIRGLINSGHLTAIEPMTGDSTSGVVMRNDIYYWDPTLQPFEVLDVRGLQRRKRADVADEEESDDDFEMSEYEKARAERVARNAERLRALGLA